jgi:hypothetical protein
MVAKNTGNMSRTSSRSFYPGPADFHLTLSFGQRGGVLITLTKTFSYRQESLVLLHSPDFSSQLSGRMLVMLRNMGAFQQPSTLTGESLEGEIGKWAFSEQNQSQGGQTTDLGGQQSSSTPNNVTRKVRQDCTPILVTDLESQDSRLLLSHMPKVTTGFPPSEESQSCSGLARGVWLLANRLLEPSLFESDTSLYCIVLLTLT